MTPAAGTPAAPTRLLTAEEYAALPDDGRLTELVRGRIVEMPRPFSNHGYYCANVAAALTAYVKSRRLGRVVSNDSGVVTERAPDSVRGPDVAYYSFAAVPEGPPPGGYWPTPELVFEVLSPSDRKGNITAKVGEYFAAGVRVVCVLDPERGLLAVYQPDELPRRYTTDEDLELPELFPDFKVRVQSFLE